MSDNYQPNDSLDFEKPLLPTGLNVLTILTFIGSGIGLLYSAASPMIISFSRKMIDKALTSGQDLTDKQIQDMAKAKQALDLASANMVPLIVIGLIGCILCIVGAVMMRKLKKDGFWIYLAGEVLPFIGGLVLMGTAQYTGVMSIVLGAVLPILFIILYAVNRKHLIY